MSAFLESDMGRVAASDESLPSATAAPMAKPTAKPKRTFLTNAQKLQLRAFWAANAQLHVQDVAEWVRRRFGVSVGRATLYRIGRAPANTFEGQRGSRKKPRRVKFPALERDVLAFCLACRQQRRALPDDLLLHKAAELRARHGISSDALKLSNGWLHSFKERHSLRTAVHAMGGGEVRSAGGGSPRAPLSSVAVAMAPCVERAESTPSTAEPLTDELDPSEVAPLTYMLAKALSSVQAVSFLNWERVGGMRDAGLFDIVDDGVCVRRAGRYQLNTDIHLSGSAPTSVSQDGWIAYRAVLPANAVVRIQFVAPGLALHTSRLVIKLVTASRRS